MKKLRVILFLLTLGPGQIATAAQLTVTWGDASSNEDGFKVERKTGTGTFAQVVAVAANITMYTDSSLANNTTYTYRTRAYNTWGDSAYSNEASATTPIPAYTLTVVKNGTGTGTVSSPPAINCGSDCTETYTSPVTLTLTATPTSGSTFTGWSGGCTGTGTCTMSINTDTTVTATFTLIPPPPPPGPVLSYSFNASSGTTVTDSSGFNNNGTISGATWHSGKYGNALTFDGINNLVTTADAASLDLTTGMTLEAWVYPTALSGGTSGGWRTVFFKEQPGALVYGLYAHSPANHASGYIFIGSEIGVQGTSLTPAETWTHLALTYDSTALRLYVNGVLKNTTSQTGAIQTSAGPLRIGGNTIRGEYFKGKIDEVRIYNRALTAAQIQTDMNTAITP